MKKLFSILTAVLLTVSVFAQSPQKMSYQAVVRDASGNLIQNTTIGIKVSILQGPTAIYTETQTALSNSNGLITIEIGNGTSSNNLSDIDWANGPYDVKTELDISGVSPYTNYTIVTIPNELISVPYSLYANIADSIAGGIIETDPVFVAAPAYNVSSIDINNWNSAYSWGNHAGLYSLINHVHNNVTTTTAGFMSAADKAKLDLLHTHYIGEPYGGGIVFYVDSTNQHGLIYKNSASYTTQYAWSTSTGLTNAQADGINGGKINTTLIIHVSPAARMCVFYNSIYGDWYLPSYKELYLLYTNRVAVGFTSTLLFWSSTEYDSTNAYYVNFATGVSNQYTAKTNTFSVVPIRSF